MLSGWQRPETPPSLHAGELHLWRASVDAPEPVGAFPRLSGAEIARAAKLRDPRDRRRWTAAHTRLRLLLGGYLDMPPEEVEFRSGVRGKPRVLPAHGRSVHFNMSRAGGVALFGFSLDREVGVDIEQERHWIDVLAVADLALDPAAVATLRRAPSAERVALFTRLWVRREALVKCTGAGITAPSDEVTPDVAVYDLEAGPGFAAAAATGGDPELVRLWLS